MITSNAGWRFVWVLCLPGCILLAAADTLASDLSRPFAEVIDYAQQRTVKIYGASIGRISGYGTGIIVSEKGEILTSQGIHLASERLRVTMNDGSLHEARVLRRSERLQVALLKIEAPTPDFFELDVQSEVQVGDWIIAVSNAFKVADGVEPLSVNLGVVSLRTPLRGTRGVQEFTYDGDVFVIDAITSNPGAAGGAVVTMQRELAGMIGKVIESKSTNTRLNYAVPRDLLADFLADVPDRDPERSVPTDPVPAPARKVDLGIRLFRLGGRRAPAFIDRVIPGSPAAKAGLRPDDLVVSFNGQVVQDVAAFQRMADSLRQLAPIELVIKRRDSLLPVELQLDSGK